MKKDNRKRPIENHKTAAWAGIKDTKPVSEVALPSELNVANAKEHVDSNEK